MNKEELVKEVSKKAKVSQKAAADVIAATLETVEKTVAKGQKVTLVGFGTFEPRKRAARSGRNPQTGATIKIAAKTGAEDQHQMFNSKCCNDNRWMTCAFVLPSITSQEMGEPFVSVNEINQLLYTV